MNSEERMMLIGAGVFLCIIGIFIAYAMPYDVESSYRYYNAYSRRYETITSTVTMYGHPAGWAFDGLGFLMILLGLIIQPNVSMLSTKRNFQGKVCGNCYLFGKGECKKQEKIFNAMPCEDFTP